MQYERKLDFSDKSVFSAKSYAQRENPNEAITEMPPFTPIDENAIIEYVSAEMKDTLGQT